MAWKDLKCPHCLHGIHIDFREEYLDRDVDAAWRISHGECSLCKRMIIFLERGELITGGPSNIYKLLDSTLVRPKASNRGPVSVEVPKEFADDYSEACLVLSDSPKASAALSRRCLQRLIREVAKINVKSGRLSDEIQQLIDSGQLPSYLVESIDTVRHIGNFAAHPNKNMNTGEVLPVEPGEAEWCLDVLESMFDFYFVQPAIIKAKRTALNEKIKASGSNASVK